MPKGGYAYAIILPTCSVWVYEFITLAPGFDASLFTSDRWFQHVSCFDYVVGAETFDVGRVELSAKEKEYPKAWRLASDYELQLGAPTPYIGSDPSKPLHERYYPITEAELPQYQESMMLTPKKLVNYLEANRHRLKLIEVDESKIVHPPSTPPPETFESASVFDIWLSGLEAMGLTDPQEIADEIDAELEKHSAGEVIGTGQTDGQDQYNIAVQNALGKNKQALSCIRRVLKRLKASPETTDIWEQNPDVPEDIEHSL